MTEGSQYCGIRNKLVLFPVDCFEEIFLSCERISALVVFFNSMLALPICRSSIFDLVESVTTVVVIYF